MEPLLLVMVRVCHVVLSVHRSLVVTCWERANLLTLLYVMFSCVFVPFPCGVLGQVRYLIDLILDICLLSNFIRSQLKRIQYKIYDSIWLKGQI